MAGISYDDETRGGAPLVKQPQRFLRSCWGVSPQGLRIKGEVRERLKRYAWKAYRLARVSRVRIPPSPHFLFIRMNQKEFIQGLPKAEVHLHLDGTLTPALFMELAKESNHPLSKRSLSEIEKLIVVSKPMRSLKEVLGVFDLIAPMLRRPRAVEKVVYELCGKAKEQNVTYVEVRYAPILSVTADFSLDEVIEVILRSLKKGEEDFGVKSGFIVTLLRNAPRKDNEAMLEAAKKFFGRGVVAIDLANDEAGYPLELFKDMFEEAKRCGIPFTIHAGEVYPTKDFGLALDLGVRRIGHGTSLVRYPDLMQEVARRKIAIEVNLTSNIRTNAVSSYKAHPVMKFLEAGIPVAIGTDDPGLFGIDLNHEYSVLLKELDFSQSDVASIAKQSFDCVFKGT